MKKKRDAIERYLWMGARPVLCSPEHAARVVSTNEMESQHIQKRFVQSTDATQFSHTYYEAAIPPPCNGFSSWCIWCGRHVLTSPGTVAPEDDEAAACCCVCVVCNGDRDVCRAGTCKGFFVAEKVRNDFHGQTEGLPLFRRAVRGDLLKNYGERTPAIFKELHRWKTATRTPGTKAQAATAPAQKAVCVICHVEFLPRCGFAGLCGACRVFPGINQHLVRLGARERSASNPAPAEDEASVPEESYRARPARPSDASRTPARKCDEASFAEAPPPRRRPRRSRPPEPD